MAKKNFESLDEAVRNAIDRVTAGVPEARKGESARNRMKEMSNRNVEAGVWREGEECVLPDEDTLDASCVVAPIVDGNEAAAVGLKTKDGKGKLLFFSSLKICLA